MGGAKADRDGGIAMAMGWGSTGPVRQGGDLEGGLGEVGVGGLPHVGEGEPPDDPEGGLLQTLGEGLGPRAPATIGHRF